MKDVMEEQQRAKIKIFVAIRDEIPKELHGGYIIMDDKLVNQAEFTGSGRIKQWKMSIDRFEVEQMVRQFDILLRRSIPLNVFLTTHAVQEGKTG